MSLANWLPRDGTVTYDAQWLGADDAEAAFAALLDEVAFTQEDIVMMGRRVAVPRLVAWHGEPGVSYRYSGVDHVAPGWTPTLDALRARLGNTRGFHPNSVLCNLYRDGRDSMGWHADRERTLGPNPTLASISLGAPRPFDLRHNRDGTTVRLELASGSLLMMSGETQHHWKHRLPKLTAPCGPRINLTFRWVT